MLKSQQLFEEIRNLIELSCNSTIKNVETQIHNDEYLARTFELREKRILFRFAKKTPKKIGHFVAMWKRDNDAKTIPYEKSDNFQLYIIAIQNGADFGIFSFPSDILVQNQILSSGIISGKRGFRLYSPSDITTNSQAQKTQFWQTKYFEHISHS